MSKSKTGAPRAASVNGPPSDPLRHPAAIAAGLFVTRKAVAAYLDARREHGEFVRRMYDLDGLPDDVVGALEAWQGIGYRGGGPEAAHLIRAIVAWADLEGAKARSYPRTAHAIRLDGRTFVASPDPEHQDPDLQAEPEAGDCEAGMLVAFVGPAAVTDLDALEAMIEGRAS